MSSIQVLSQGSWPIKQKDAIMIEYPPMIKALHSKFEMFYKRKHNNTKKLVMLNQYGSVEVKPLFVADKKPYQLNVNVVQAAILALFN